MAVVGEEMEHVDNNGRGGGWALPSFYNSVHLDTEISSLLLLQLNNTEEKLWKTQINSRVSHSNI